MTATEAAPIQHVPPSTVREWLDSSKATLVDVRESFEVAAESIPGSQHVPLSSFDPSQLRDQLGDDVRVVFACRTGQRSQQAALRYAELSGEAIHLAGGLQAWKAEGFDLLRSAGAPRLDVMRQVQLIAGSLVLTGVILGVTVSEWFLALSGFVGAGLMFAGASGWCGMAMLLGKMPWNRPAACR